MPGLLSCGLTVRLVCSIVVIVKERKNVNNPATQRAYAVESLSHFRRLVRGVDAVASAIDSSVALAAAFSTGIIVHQVARTTASGTREFERRLVFTFVEGELLKELEMVTSVSHSARCTGR